MVPILTIDKLDSHESFFQNQFFGVSSSVDATPLNDNVRVLTIGIVIFESEEVKEVREIIESKLIQFVQCNNIDNGIEYDSFILEESRFGFILQHCAIDLNFDLELINKFFVSLIDELNIVFGD